MFETLEAISDKLNNQIRFYEDKADLHAIEQTAEELATEIERLKSNPEEIGKDALRQMQENDPSGEYTFEFEETSDPRKAKPYVARLSAKDGNLDRDFFDFDLTYGRKEVTVYGEYTVCPGDIIEIQTGGSWNNKYRHWHICLAGGELKELGHYQDSRLKMRILKYLQGAPMKIFALE